MHAPHVEFTCVCFALVVPGFYQPDGCAALGRATRPLTWVPHPCGLCEGAVPEPDFSRSPLRGPLRFTQRHESTHKTPGHASHLDADGCILRANCGGLDD